MKDHAWLTVDNGEEPMDSRRGDVAVCADPVLWLEAPGHQVLNLWNDAEPVRRR